MKFSNAVRAIALAAILLSNTRGQEAPKLTSSQLAEASQASAYFQQNNLVAALPLYEHLAAEIPQSPAYAERLAFCLMSKAENLPPGEEKDATFKRVKAEAERAKALGDQSNLLQVILERVNADPSKVVIDSSPKMRAAETAFSKGDLDGALALYKEIAGDDPNSYEARLFAGDMYFRKHDVAGAGEWFQQAIAVDPNRETAYRYWGDALFADGQKDAALQKFIDAVVAQPYDRKAFAGLSQWAQRTGATLRAPSVKIPKAPETQKTEDGKTTTNITIDASLMNDPKSGSSAWLMYPMNRSLWRSEKFAKEFPNEKEYRHSLAEERESLDLVLSSVKTQNVPDDKLDPSLHDLVLIGRDGMLEPLILLNLADRGIAQDYDAYRALHRDRIHAYIEKYLVHPRGAAN